MNGTFRAVKRSGFTGRIEFVAVGDGILLALTGPSFRAGRLIGVKEEAMIGIGENDGTDVPPFHDQAGETGAACDVRLSPLVVEEGLSDRDQGGKAGDSGVNLGGSEPIRFGDLSVDRKPCTPTFKPGIEFQFLQDGSERSLGSRIGPDVKKGGGQRPIVGTGVHMHQVELLGHRAGGGRFAGGGSAVDGDDLKN